MKSKYILQFLIGIAIIIGFLFFVDIKTVASTFSKINLFYFACAMVTYVVMNLVFIYRMSLFFKATGKKISIKEMLLPQFGAMLASDVTPGRSGYMIFPLLIKKDVPLESGFSAILSMQVIDFLIKIIGSVLAIIMLTRIASIETSLLLLTFAGIIVVLVFVLIIAFALWSKKAENILIFLSKLPIVGKICHKLVEKIESFQAEARHMKHILLPVIGLTLISWLAKGVEWMFIGMAVGFNFPFLVYFLIQPLITILQFVPITPAGLGFQEGMGMFVLIMLGASFESAFVFNILIRLVLLFVNLVGIPTLAGEGVDLLEINLMKEKVKKNEHKRR